MTGEISLTGRILPVGGIREKIIAARRSLVNELILPMDNKKDWEELPDHLKEGMIIHFVDSFAKVLEIVQLI